MPCYSPLKAYRSQHLTSSGKRGIVFTPKDAFIDMHLNLPCGQCIGCRLERSRQWAIRCSHEAAMHEDNCFITLTYNDEHLPSDLSLRKRDLQLFMKRLRNRFGDGIRFYACGEYGSQYGRPHYHAILFNFDFPDKKLWKIDNGNPLHTSSILEELWPFGFSSIGAATFETAAYVARYILKKVTGKNAGAHYQSLDLETGEIYDRTPEFTNMSRRPGIGATWFEKFSTDVYPSDEVIIRGKALKPPRYYDSLYERVYPSDLERVKLQRVQSAKQFVDNNTPERLHVREQVQLARLKHLPRPLD